MCAGYICGSRSPLRSNATNCLASFRPSCSPSRYVLVYWCGLTVLVFAVKPRLSLRQPGHMTHPARGTASKSSFYHNQRQLYSTDLPSSRAPSRQQNWKSPGWVTWDKTLVSTKTFSIHSSQHLWFQVRGDYICTQQDQYGNKDFPL